MEIIKVGKVPEQKKYISTCWYCCTEFSFVKSEARRDIVISYARGGEVRRAWLLVSCPLCGREVKEPE